MSVVVPNSHRDLLTGPVTVALATVMPDGQPQVTPAWCLFDGAYVLLNTAAGREKERNMRAHPKVTVLAIDPQDPYRWLEVRGEIVEIKEENAVDEIDEMARLYTERSHYYEGNEAQKARETRITFKVRPTRVLH